ncbi:hypothetical protein HJO_14432 [Hyphomonas johnsonii MHS-2]|uniref:Lipoprotein n=1 Tax=Hyphomonas johnsonii MHS-2 TaxID=1280950 RepID=A0A059FFX4_9PROT|nr:hypothetical protein HJO_14432 [Hyphomonas johnsonii MHS-2]
MRLAVLIPPAILLSGACAHREPSTPLPQAASICDDIDSASDRQMCRDRQASQTVPDALERDRARAGIPPSRCSQDPVACETRPEPERCAMNPGSCDLKPTEPL